MDQTIKRSSIGSLGKHTKVSRVREAGGMFDGLNESAPGGGDGAAMFGAAVMDFVLGSEVEHV